MEYEYNKKWETAVEMNDCLQISTDLLLIHVKTGNKNATERDKTILYNNTQKVNLHVTVTNHEHTAHKA